MTDICKRYDTVSRAFDSLARETSLPDQIDKSIKTIGEMMSILRNAGWELAQDNLKETWKIKKVLVRTATVTFLSHYLTL